MKSEFYEIYEILYSEYVYEQEFRRRRLFLYDDYPHDEWYIIKKIRMSIDKSDKENTLRPDAKYFLLVNFHQLIIKPLFEQHYYRETFYLEIEFDIETDIETIISETKKEAEQGEVSGHQVMRTIDRVWKSLRTTRFELWG